MQAVPRNRYVSIMYSVVNRLLLASPVPAEVWDEPAKVVLAKLREVEGFHSVQVVEVSSEELVLVITADTAERLDQIATEVGSPWIIEHIAPHLAGPPNRQVGKVLMSSAGT